MTAFFKKLWTSISDLLTSKKVMLAVGTAVSQAVITNGDIKKAALAAGVAAIVGQGAADFGKNAAPKP